MNHLRDLFAPFIELISRSVIFDEETTGLDPVSLQNTQHASITTDSNLNILRTHNQFSRVRPDVNISPESILVTKNTDCLGQDGLSHYEMMLEIDEDFSKTIQEGATRFITYNGDRFDEPIIQRNRFLNLFDPYVTSMHGQQRMDLLKLIWTLVCFFPEFPRTIDNKGILRCKLENVAANLDITHLNAHDALADCKTTLAVLKFIKSNYPDVYYSGLINSSKEGTVAFFENVEPFLVMGEVYRSPFTNPVVMISYAQKGNGIALFNLSFDPSDVVSLSYSEVEELVHSPQSGPIKVVQKNKTQPILPESSVNNLEQHFNISYTELCRRAKLIKRDEGFKEKVRKALSSKTYKSSPCTTAENSIYNGPWISDEDKLYSQRFHLAPLHEKWCMQENFSDWRWREFANRILCQHDLKNAPKELRNWYERFIWTRRHTKWSKDKQFLTNEMALSKTKKLIQESKSKSDLKILQEVEKFLVRRSI